MISGLPLTRLVLLAATVAALVAATATTSADSGGHKGPAARVAAWARDQQQRPASHIFQPEPATGEPRAAARGQPVGENNPEPSGVEVQQPSKAAAGSGQLATRQVGRLQTRSSPAASASVSVSVSRTSSSQFPGEAEIVKPAAVEESDSLTAAIVQAKLATSAALANHRSPVYTNQFVILVKGGELEARKLAEKHGFSYLNHILGDYHHLEHRRLSKRSTSLHQDALNISIQDEPQVLLLERQVLKRRVKRDFLEFPSQQQPPTSHHEQHPSARGQPPTPVTLLAAASQNSHPLLRPANQPPQAQQRPQQQLRPNSNPNAARKPAAGGQYTRPANQPRGPQPNHLRPPNPQHPAQELPAAGRTQELLEAAASNAGLLFQQATAAAAALGGAPNPKQAGSPARSQQQTAQTTTAATISPAPTLSNTTLGGRQTNGAGDGNANANGKQHMPFNDPSWPLMWYLDGGAKNGFDLNVMAAWKMGYTGKGIVITILDDGLEKDHPDLQANYDPLASFDINGDDADPMPRYDVNDSNRHGTRCAGEVAAVPDNNICSIGIAYNSKVGGVRMLDGDVTDAVEARSLGLNNQHIHIYSASWGPDDNGKTVDGPGEMATRAFIEGVTNGRQGLGSIFVFASGNGGREHDNCNCDGYTNSIWTLSISSATENGYVPWYIEACSSTLATTYSSGSYEERQIATTDLHHSCTSSHTGTSASAPLAAGICALVLESNPKLTWRDMQHIVVRTAKPANLVAKDWRTNALGRNVSHAFGYGLMDAAAMITMAKRWTTVPIQYTCEVRSPQMEKFIPAKGYIELKLRAECANVRYLEHVQSKVTLTASRRGDLHIYLVSPHGTRSTLLAQRPNDQAEQGFRNWPFMTVHSWGESPNGIWTLEVHNDGKPQNRAYLKEWTLILYGTSEDPNKHLDSAALTAAVASQSGSLPPPNRPKQTTVTSTLPPPTPSTTTTTTPANELTTISAKPPAPIPAIAGQYPSVELEPMPPPSRPSSHWSFSSPPPPPVSAPGLGLATSQPSNPATTPASYVTTFKTIVNSNNNNNNIAPPIQTHESNGRIEPLGQPPISAISGQTGKADFEIVSPATTQAPHPPHSIQNNMSIITSSPTTTTTAADGMRPVDPDGITKPSVSQLDISGAPQPTGSSNAGSNRPGEHPTPNQQHLPGMSGPSTNELDGNQIDSKLTKDYRSSGHDQSIYAPNKPMKANDRMIAANGGQEGDPTGKMATIGGSSEQQQPPGSAAPSTLNQPLAALSSSSPLITLLMLAIILSSHHYLTDRLVRLEYVLPGA